MQGNKKGKESHKIRITMPQHRQYLNGKTQKIIYSRIAQQPRSRGPGKLPLEMAPPGLSPWPMCRLAVVGPVPAMRAGLGDAHPLRAFGKHSSPRPSRMTTTVIIFY